MINKNELSIGNIVLKRCGETMIPYRIKNGLEIDNEVFYALNLHFYYLEKLGFSFHSCNNTFRALLGNNKIEITCINNSYTFLNKEIKYLHHFQNLLLIYYNFEFETFDYDLFGNKILK